MRPAADQGLHRTNHDVHVMKTALLNEHGGLRTSALVLATGDEAIGAISAFALDHQLRATHFTAIGAFSRVVVAYFDWTTKEYRKIRIDEQVEVLSMVGDITLESGKPKVHAHVVVSKADATAHGGHLVEGIVRPTLEIVITETPGYLRRRFDSQSGLALIDPDARA
jgi:predicted DNA-binding protein with PD1-like motif